MRHLLECKAWRAVGVAEHQPVLAFSVGPAVSGRFVTWTVLKSQQLAIELGQRSGIFAVQHDLAQSGRRYGGVTHVCMLAEPPDWPTSRTEMRCRIVARASRK